jgi:hypothetical protein
MIDFTKLKFDSIKMINFKNISGSIKNDHSRFIIKTNFTYKFKFPKLVRKNLNILKQLQPSEPQHSKILGSLLDPHGRHGFGDLFLREFFDLVIDDADFLYEGKERWYVTIEKNHFDISIRNKNGTKIIIIENKSNGAEDKQNQLYRYWLSGIYKTQSGIYKTQYVFEKHGIPHFAKIMYLSPSYEKNYSRQTITRPKTEDEEYPKEIPEGIIKTVFFGDHIVFWLEKCMALMDKTDDLFFYIKQYKEFWRDSMANEIVNQVEELFKDKEQLVSFLDLTAQWNTIRNSWWQNFKGSVNKFFAINNAVEGWGFISWGYWDYRWFIKEFGEKSLCLWCREWYGNYTLDLWADPNLYDVVKISGLLQEQKYLPIVSAFERIDEIPAPTSAEKIFEHGNYQFGDTMDGHFDINRLAWYAHYQPDEFVSQILRKIDRFRKDEAVTKLLREINTITKNVNKPNVA